MEFGIRGPTDCVTLNKSIPHSESISSSIKWEYCLQRIKCDNTGKERGELQALNHHTFNLKFEFCRKVSHRLILKTTSLVNKKDINF